MSSKLNIKASEIREQIAQSTPDKKAFSNEPNQVQKVKPKLQNFRFDNETAALLDDLSFLLCGSNKTLTLKAALHALQQLSPEQQRNLLMSIK